MSVERSSTIGFTGNCHQLLYSCLQKGWQSRFWHFENKQNKTDPRLGFALLKHDEAWYIHSGF
jgi:hypothetical protein